MRAGYNNNVRQNNKTKQRRIAMKYINNEFYSHQDSIKEINHIIENVAKKGEEYIYTNFEGKGGETFTITIKETKYSGWKVFSKENKGA